MAFEQQFSLNLVNQFYKTKKLVNSVKFHNNSTNGKLGKHNLLVVQDDDGGARRWCNSSKTSGYSGGEGGGGGGADAFFS